MAFIPVPDAVRVTIFGHTGARTWSFNLWFYMPGFDAQDMENLADYLETFLDTSLKGQVATTTNFDQIVIYDMNDDEGAKVVLDIDIAGTAAGALMPVNNALCLSLYSTKRGKWNQGRVYLCGFTEEAGDEKDWTQAKADGVVAAFQTILDTPPTGWTWSVVSRFKDKQPRTAGVHSAITTLSVRNLVFASQRRRLRKT